MLHHGRGRRILAEDSDAANRGVPMVWMRYTIPTPEFAATEVELDYGDGLRRITRGLREDYERITEDYGGLR